MRAFRRIAALGLGLFATACASATQLSAAGDIHAFLLSIRDDDQAAFDAHVDRDALKAQLTARLTAAAQRQGGQYPSLASVLGPAVAELAVDSLVQPRVFRAAAEALGYSRDKPIPGPVGIAQALKSIDADHVCAVTKRGGPCVLDFTNEGGMWRLTAFEGDRSLLRLPRGVGL